jgi:hypothetical protein
MKIQENEVYYLISAKWVEKLFIFMETESNEKYEISLVLSLYLDHDEKHFLGAYPGPINNTPLLSYSDILFDPEDSLSNFPTRKNLKENQDFFIIDKDNFEILKQTFGCYFELPRKAIKHNEEIILEVNFFKVSFILI